MHSSMHLNSKMRPMILVTASLETAQVLPALDQVSAAVATASYFLGICCELASANASSRMQRCWMFGQREIL